MSKPNDNIAAPPGPVMTMHPSTEPENIAPVSGTTAPTRKPVEQLANEKKTPAWLFAAARAFHGWPIGRELTEAEFDKATAATSGIRIGAQKGKR